MLLQSPDPSPWLQVFGRFHLLLLHLPIGLIPGLFLLEIGAAVFRRPLPKGAITTLSVLTALCAAAALASGLVLAEEKVDSGLLQKHKNFAIAMAAVCVLLPILAPRKSRRPFRVALAAALALTIPTGHFGGSLTHRDGFLFQPLERAAKRAAAQDGGTQDGGTQDGGTQDGADQNGGERAPEPPPDPQPDQPGGDVVSYAVHVAPILKRTCTSCHNADDFEGDLDLTTYELVVGAGYEDDPYVIKGKPDDSYLIEVCELPLDDEMHMPPKDEETQITKDEIAVLRRWIAGGCAK